MTRGDQLETLDDNRRMNFWPRKDHFLGDSNT